ncbi:uncharacterized protein N7483_012704 [Penicillium malachiteum]|uniref:uncharacterized protein n=1 Tax=Penicillium malachiteum TaxID=1324776 RepID=UPI0025496203|nr:uncharacterized protein N7483_012704 [Penicillium malachiteum]KAJ5715523.1 hypothetical protein N7483_012704 [Penicillium malachiteum]
MRRGNRPNWLECPSQLEISAAIKCPSILGHLTTFKKLQQALTAPGALESFLTDSEAATIRETFVPVLSLDQSEEGLRALSLATDPERAVDYILKPSLEGGGNNIHGEEILEFLASIPESRWSSYILMERIQSPVLSNILMSPIGVESGEVVSELVLMEKGFTSWGLCTAS